MHSFADVKLANAEGGVRIDFGDSSVLVAGQTAESMSAADFKFTVDPDIRAPLPPHQLPDLKIDPIGPIEKYSHLAMDALITKNETQHLATAFQGVHQASVNNDPLLTHAVATSPQVSHALTNAEAPMLSLHDMVATHDVSHASINHLLLDMHHG